MNVDVNRYINKSIYKIRINEWDKSKHKSNYNNKTIKMK